MYTFFNCLSLARITIIETKTPLTRYPQMTTKTRGSGASTNILEEKKMKAYFFTFYTDISLHFKQIFLYILHKYVKYVFTFYTNIASHSLLSGQYHCYVLSFSIVLNVNILNFFFKCICLCLCIFVGLVMC